MITWAIIMLSKIFVDLKIIFVELHRVEMWVNRDSIIKFYCCFFFECIVKRKDVFLKQQIDQHFMILIPFNSHFLHLLKFILKLIFNLIYLTLFHNKKYRISKGVSHCRSLATLILENIWVTKVTSLSIGYKWF